MTLTHNIYNDLSVSLSAGKHQTLSKVYTTPNGISLIYAMNRDTEKRALYFVAEEKSVDSMPRCKGLDIGKVHLYEYSPVDFFCEIAQNSGDESYMFEIIIEDIRKNADELNDKQQLVARVSKLLIKWKSFFAQEKTLMLSPERQQGLYGELLFLKQLIGMVGTSAVSFWTGCDDEAHDFYIRGNAVEIKTTSSKAPYKMHISSEYQLDDSEISGELLVDFFALRKSSADGETLPQLIDDIRFKLDDNPLMRKKFDTNLETYGYFDGLEDKYTTGYHIREEHSYRVTDRFPRIVKRDISNGISGCTYDVLVNSCASFEIAASEKEHKMKGSEEIV